MIAGGTAIGDSNFFTRTFVSTQYSAFHTTMEWMRQLIEMSENGRLGGMDEYQRQRTK
jgi:hypothetical protein